MRLASVTGLLLIKTGSGFILITVLLLLSILSMTAFLAVERSQFSLRTNSNRLAYLEAKHHAEESRRMALPLLDAQLREQPLDLQALPGVQLHTNVSRLSTAANTNRRYKASLSPLLSIRQAELQGEVFVLALPGQLNTQGVSLVQHRAYQGAGQGLGTAASFSRYFELRAKGIAQAEGVEIGRAHV